MPEQLPEEMLDPASPPGVPTGVQSQAADVYCWHPDGQGGDVAVRWEHRPEGYMADDRLSEQHPGHNEPARDVGVIAAMCGPVTATNHPGVNPLRIAQVRAEVEREMPPSIGL